MMLANIDWGSIATNVAAGAVGAIPTVYLLAKFLGSKWVDAWFVQRLEQNKQTFQREIELQKADFQREIEASKQSHASDLERIKFERSGIFDRATRLNQREFEIIPQLWKRTTFAHDTLSRAIRRFHSTPDFRVMKEQEAANFIETSNLQDWQKDEMKALPDHLRTAYYADAMIWINLREAESAKAKFNRAYLTGIIFIHPDTVEKFEPIANLFNGALFEYRLERQAKLDGERLEPDEVENLENYRENGRQIYDDLAKYLRERYWITADGQAV